VFIIVRPTDAGYYIVAPEETADTRKIAVLRDRLLCSVAKTLYAARGDNRIRSGN
jgi:hypothetical protein